MADACVFIMENVDFTDIIRNMSLPGEATTRQTQQPNIQFRGEIRNTHINIGTGKEISIKALAELIKETVGFKGELVFNSSKPDGTMRKLTDVSKLNHLGWHHQIEIEEGIRRIYHWYIENSRH
jgi:GDP-L-fucose synthase